MSKKYCMGCHKLRRRRKKPKLAERVKIATRVVKALWKRASDDERTQIAQHFGNVATHMTTTSLGLENDSAIMIQLDSPLSRLLDSIAMHARATNTDFSVVIEGLIRKLDPDAALRQN